MCDGLSNTTSFRHNTDIIRSGSLTAATIWCLMMSSAPRNVARSVSSSSPGVAAGGGTQPTTEGRLKMLRLSLFSSAFFLFALSTSMKIPIAPSTIEFLVFDSISTVSPITQDEKASSAKSEQPIRLVVPPLTQVAGSYVHDLDDLNCTAPFQAVHDRIVEKSSDRYEGNIPRIVHLSMTSRCLHELTAIGVQRWKDALPNHDVYFHDDAAVDRLFALDWPEFPHLNKVMNCVRFKGAMKIDVWRILVVYRYGGIYADIDTWPGTDFDENTIRPEDEFFSLSDVRRRPSQWFFAMKPRHPIAYFTVMEILKNVLALQNIAEPRPVFTTGPEALKVGYGTALGSYDPMNNIYQKEGTHISEKYNCTARKLVGSMDTMDLVTGNMDTMVVWNATRNVTVRKKLELDTGELHWIEQIARGRTSKSRKGTCLDLLYDLEREDSFNS